MSTSKLKKKMLPEEEYYEYLSDISLRFNRIIGEFIDIGTSKAPDNLNLDRIKRIFNLGKSIDETAPIKECIDNVWLYKDKIKKRDDSFIEEYQETAKNRIDKDQHKHADLIEYMIIYIKEHKNEITPEEMEYIWSLADKMLEYVGEYRALVEHGVIFYKHFLKQLKNKRN